MKEKYIEDLREIKKMMNLSTRFISLSGLSGVSIGIIALFGVWFADHIVFKDQNYLVADRIELSDKSITHILLIAIGTLLLSTITAIFFTVKKSKQQNQNVWNHQTKRLLINLFIPLIAGGLLCFILLFKGFIGLLPPLTLMFYGLALVNASKYTLPEIRSLGLFEIVLGLIAVQLIDYGLFLWAFGFGILHIAYGLFIQRKYQS